MIVVAGIVPYSPLQLPVREELAQFFTPLQTAITSIVNDCDMRRVDTLVFLSTHSHNDAILINASHTIKPSFSLFADATRLPTFSTDVRLMYRLRQILEGRENALLTHVSVSREPALLGLLPFHRLGTKIVSLSVPNNGDIHRMLRLGSLWRDIFENHHQRCGIIVSGTLSQALRRGSPFPPHPQARIFDAQFRECWLAGDMKPMYEFSLEDRHGCAETAVAATTVLQGILQDMDIHPKILAYDSQTGIGYTAGVWI